MRVYLVAGNNSASLKQILEKDSAIEVICLDSSLSNAFQNLVENDVDFDVLLLIDQGIGNNIENFAKTLKDFKELIDSLIPDAQFKFITKEPQFLKVFLNITSQDQRFEAHFIDKPKIPISFLQEVCMIKKSYADTVLLSETAEPIRRKLWNGFRKNSAAGTNDENNIYQNSPDNLQSIKTSYPERSQSLRVHHFPHNTSRIVALTGHRGSGVSSTVSNLAVEASNRGLNVFILDLDFLCRGINLYFSKFGEEVDLNPDLAYSPVKCMIKPDSYHENACIINDNLYVSTLAFSISDNDKMLEQVNPRRLIAMLGVLKSRFQLILLDLPVEVFRKFPDILLHIDFIGLCVNNNLYSILNTVRSINMYCKNEDMLIFKMKTKLILTKYNSLNTHRGSLLSKELFLKIMLSVCDLFDSSLEFAGVVPFLSDFDRQVDSGKKLCSTNSDYSEYYLNILKCFV